MRTLGTVFAVSLMLIGLAALTAAWVTIVLPVFEQISILLNNY